MDKQNIKFWPIPITLVLGCILFMEVAHNSPVHRYVWRRNSNKHYKLYDFYFWYFAADALNIAKCVFYTIFIDVSDPEHQKIGPKKERFLVYIVILLFRSFVWYGI